MEKPRSGESALGRPALMHSAASEAAAATLGGFGGEAAWDLPRYCVKV